MVPLNYALANGQRVEIVAAKTGGPSRDWLNPLLGYIVSPRARSKVRQWFNGQNVQSAVALGRTTVEREAHRVGVALPALEELAQRLGFAKAEDCLIAVGRGEIGLRQLQVVLRGETEPKAQEEASIVPARARATGKGGGVLVVGVENLLTTLGKCCKPASPDPIIGFVTRGRGVTVHRRACRNLSSMPEERMIAAEWGPTEGQHFPVDIRIEARDRQGLLRDISEILSRERINVTATETLAGAISLPWDSRWRWKTWTSSPRCWVSSARLEAYPRGAGVAARHAREIEAGPCFTYTLDPCRRVAQLVRAPP